MNITEDECATCGSMLEEVRPGKWQCQKCELDQMMTDRYNAGYQAGLAKVQADDDDDFWLRQYAGQAMQGILAADTQSLLYPYQIVQQSIDCAKALLEEVKKCKS